MQRPFLKWAGGKSRVLKHLLPALLKDIADQHRILVEPFVGAGSIFLNVPASAYWINDTNPDLMHVYTFLKNHPEDFIRDAEFFFQERSNHRDFYEAARWRFNQSEQAYERALLFLYLNRHGYNGLCRYNRQGQYNVPFGSHKKPYYPLAEMHYYVGYQKQADWQITATDFESCMQNAPEKALIYCDPPYVPLSATASFTHYAKGGFSFEEQQRLASCARRCAQKGSRVLISNHDLPIVRELYQGAHFISFSVQRNLSVCTTQRGTVPELLAIFE